MEFIAGEGHSCEGLWVKRPHRTSAGRRPGAQRSPGGGRGLPGPASGPSSPGRCHDAACSWTLAEGLPSLIPDSRSEPPPDQSAWRAAAAGLCEQGGHPSSDVSVFWSFPEVHTAGTFRGFVSRADKLTSGDSNRVYTYYVNILSRTEAVSCVCLSPCLRPVTSTGSSNRGAVAAHPQAPRVITSDKVLTQMLGGTSCAQSF